MTQEKIFEKMRQQLERRFGVVGWMGSDAGLPLHMKSLSQIWVFQVPSLGALLNSQPSGLKNRKSVQRNRNYEDGWMQLSLENVPSVT